MLVQNNSLLGRQGRESVNNNGCKKKMEQHTACGDSANTEQ